MALLQTINTIKDLTFRIAVSWLQEFARIKMSFMLSSSTLHAIRSFLSCISIHRETNIHGASYHLSPMGPCVYVWTIEHI